jgi:hypothetical protein
MSGPAFRRSESSNFMMISRTTRVRGRALAALSLLLSGCSGAARPLDGPAMDLRALTGAHTRVVWVQGDGTDPLALGDQLVLMGFDTDDGKGERVILGARSGYVKPLITPRGNRIVYSTRALRGPPEVFIVNWDGSGLRKIAGGFALDVWSDPAGGTEWVYVGTESREDNFATVSRFPIDEPGRRELVWDKTLVSTDTFQVSSDGRHAGGIFPWPDAGVATLPNGPLRKLGEGCWTALSSARGLLFWYFDGAHRNLTMVDVDGAEVYHPRWTNHPRVMAISGPYNQGGSNQARTGGTQVEIYLGRFSADFSTVEAWARVTSNSGGDSYPDAWVDLARSPIAQRPAGPIGPAAAAGAGGGVPAGQGDRGRLVVKVRLTRAGPIPTPREILPYRHALVVNEYEILDVLDGAYPARAMPIAQWAIRDGRVLAEARRTAGTTFTLTVDRYDAHAELEGERLISDTQETLPLYYDTGSR